MDDNNNSDEKRKRKKRNVNLQKEKASQNGLYKKNVAL
jgi:hypothetical protein